MVKKANLWLSTQFSVVVLFVLIAIGARIARSGLDLSGPFPLKVVLIFGAASTLVLMLAGRHLPPDSFGPANLVTLFRAGMTAMLFALIGEARNSDVAWLGALLAILAVSLDGVDGWIARRRGESSDFGARFDMETDALLILGISVLAWQHGKAGIWILAAGLMRYLFVAAGYVLPWMRRSLRCSLRRRVVCVAQALTLGVCLMPSLPSPGSDVLALAGLMTLTWSFAIDVIWLARQAQLEGLNPTMGPEQPSRSSG